MNWFSRVLGMDTQTCILFPEVGEPPYPVYYLLHGRANCASSWLRRTRLEDYAASMPMIIVMPGGYRSFYTDHEDGFAYAQYAGVELPQRIEAMLPADPLRCAVGGLSMGGYGALRIGLGWPEKFTSINSHSGALEWGWLSPRQLDDIYAKPPEEFSEIRRMFGDNPRGSEHDLHALALRAKRAGKLPKILIDCGEEDILIDENRAFTKFLNEENIPHIYREFPGEHNWEYWDLHVREALEFHATNFGLETTDEHR